MNPTYEREMERRHRPKSGSEERCPCIIKETAQAYVEARVTENINDHCILKPLEEEYRGGLESKWAWDFRDLRGAMHLRLMWLMERGAKVGRCKWCGDAYPGKGPKGKKSPPKKRFCGPACRVAYDRANERSG